ncbi:hypothetical protein F511_06203 [Dorcoceras hygrometricum]|uniref:Uncharacterized protein n=1 Tax=Dorcoceras hygrometricum TaxID=472368 RepID=A0A2Z7D2N7_9LAMI|nr:hypothetical protein F511_06203 [Dorcoceras hygrometricum]
MDPSNKESVSACIRKGMCNMESSSHRDMVLGRLPSNWRASGSSGELLGPRVPRWLWGASGVSPARAAISDEGCDVTERRVGKLTRSRIRYSRSVVENQLLVANQQLAIQRRKGSSDANQQLAIQRRKGSSDANSAVDDLATQRRI